MDELVRERLGAIHELCRRLQIGRLELFGSAATGQLGADSDVDFIVDMDADFDRYFDLKEGLERLLGRSVDLLSASSIEKPHLRARIEETKIGIYPP